MRALSLDGVRHAVVVAPHSDDETISAFLAISALRQRAARVDVVVVTDGSASHRSSCAYPKPKLVGMRKSETLLAMRLAEVPPERVTFLGLPDGGLRDLTVKEVQNAMRRMRFRPRPDLLIVPSAHDDHPDHREVAGWCDRTWPISIPRLRYIVWPSRTSQPHAGRNEIGILGNHAAKRTALRRYRSQLGLIRDDPGGFCLTADMIARMCRPCERFSCR